LAENRKLRLDLYRLFDVSCQRAPTVLVSKKPPARTRSNAYVECNK